MEQIDIPVLYQDENLLVINKPSGVLTHPDKNNGSSVQGWLEEKYPELRQVGEPIKIDGQQQVDRFGIAHRLDKDTSGVLLITKNHTSFNFLKGQFQQREVRKIYYGFVYGRLKRSRGLIDRSIGRHRKDPRRRAVGDKVRGESRDAQTTYVTEQTGSDASLLKLIPHTGRTHQLRVHCLSLGHPIIGDPLYAPGRQFLLGFDRLALHAYSITFYQHQGAEPTTVTAPWPEDLQRAKEKLTDQLNDAKDGKGAKLI